MCLLCFQVVLMLACLPYIVGWEINTSSLTIFLQRLSKVSNLYGDCRLKMILMKKSDQSLWRCQIKQYFLGGCWQLQLLTLNLFGSFTCRGIPSIPLTRYKKYSSVKVYQIFMCRGIPSIQVARYTN